MTLKHEKGRTLDIDGARIHVQRVEAKGSSEIVLLHGGLGTLEDFTAFVPHLEGHAITAIDTRGHGASTLGTGKLSYPRLADDVEAILAKLELKNPILLGHSDGGITALHVALRNRTPLRGVVTLGAHADPPEPEIRPIYEKLTEKSWRDRFAAGVALQERLNPEKDFSKLFDAALAMWKTWDGDNYPGDAVRAITCPLLCLSGDEDHLVPARTTLRMKERIPKAHVGVVPFGTHMMHAERPALVAPFVRAFLDEITAKKH